MMFILFAWTYLVAGVAVVFTGYIFLPEKPNPGEDFVLWAVLLWPFVVVAVLIVAATCLCGFIGKYIIAAGEGLRGVFRQD